jgi:(E)-4-hydroxy-3-methylbut-2-enyl-diphosphate synthase
MDPEPQPFDMDTVVAEVEERLADYDDPIEIAVLSTAVYGIGEAREFDFGITGAKDTGIIYAKGQPLKTVPIKQLVEELFREVDRYYAAGKKVVIADTQAAEAARWLSENEDDRAV